MNEIQQRPQQAAMRHGRPLARRQRILVACGVVLMAACGLLVYRFSRRDPPRPETSLLLLPFSDSIASEGDYLALGLAATLTHQLGELPDLDVPSPALWSYAKPEIGPRRLAARLGFTEFLEGELSRGDGSLELRLLVSRMADPSRGRSLEVSTSMDSLIDLQIQLLTTVALELGRPLGTGELNRAQRTLSRSNKAYDDYLRALDYLADTAQPRGPRFAIELLHRATRLDPQFTLAWLTLGRAEWRSSFISGGETSDLLQAALRSIERGEQSLPRTRFGAVSRVLVHKSLDSTVDCRQATRKWGSRHFRSSTQMMDMAAAYFQVGALLAAEDCLQAADEADRNDLRSRSRWGDFLWRTGRLFEARQVYAQVQQTAGTEAVAPASSLLLLQLQSEDYRRAIETFEGTAATVLDAHQAVALATAYDAIGDPAEAERLVRIAVSEAPEEPRFHEALADLLVRRGNDEEGRREYRAALTLFQHDRPIVPAGSKLELWETVLLAKAGECDRAVPRAANFSRHRRPRADASLDLARAFAACEQADRARQSLEQALELGFPLHEVASDPLLGDLVVPSSPLPSGYGTVPATDGG